MPFALGGGGSLWEPERAFDTVTKTAAPDGTVSRLASCARTAIRTGAAPVPYRFGCTVLLTRLWQFRGISGLRCGNQGDVRTSGARRKSIAARVHLFEGKPQLCRCQGRCCTAHSLFFGGPRAWRLRYFYAPLQGTLGGTTHVCAMRPRCGGADPEQPNKEERKHKTDSATRPP